LKIKPILALGVLLLLLGLGGTGCSPTQDFDQNLRAIVKPYDFSTVAWEIKTIPHELNQLTSGWRDRTTDEVQLVTNYFGIVNRIIVLKSQAQAINQGMVTGDLAPLKAELAELEPQELAKRDEVERILEKQIKTVLAEQGIFNPLDSYLRIKINFPPLNFSLEEPPHLLVISPTDRIESIREILLKQDISLEEMETIEAEVDQLGVSSLVVELGGLGATYPSFVTNEASLKFTIDTASEEWLHQYLFFRPLGFLYALDLTGLAPDYEIATIDETVASMASKEIGTLVRDKYYQQYESALQPSQEEESGFDFNREMRDIRRQVDQYLAQGEIKLAEEFMEQKRQYLADNGYYIRKLNQAYFAFYGTYADSPTSVSPIGVELDKLREQSASLKDFLDIAATITSRQQLSDLLK
jgi:hypothetical protein